jgi:ATP-binding cassette, subfamily B (MDR/TAP), member 1
MDALDDESKRQLVKEACVKAFADEFIQALPQGYDTTVGERGSSEYSIHSEFQPWAQC